VSAETAADGEPAPCSGIARALAEPLIGTAPVASTWVAVEQPGPWGRQALRDSHLDPATGAALEAWAVGTGVSLLLIRRPGPHADDHHAAPHAVLIGHGSRHGSWLHRLHVADPTDLLGLDPVALGRGVPPVDGEPVDGVAALVCTNGRRDRCCALLGRELAAALHREHPGRVWECTHLGGHRFAPTALLLPTGLVYGHLDAATALAAWATAEQGHVQPTGLRGWSTLPPQGQVADSAVRAAAGVDDLAALTTQTPAATGEGRWSVRVSHVDGREWTVLVEAGKSDPPRPESCGRTPVSPRRWSLVTLQATTHSRSRGSQECPVGPRTQREPR